MCFVAVAQRYPVRTAFVSFALGGAAALLSAWVLGAVWGRERIVEVERIVEKPAVTGTEKNTEEPVAREVARGRADLIVMQKNKPMGLDSDFSEYFVSETRKMPEVARVSEGVVSAANTMGHEGIQFLVQGWQPDNFGFEDLDVLSGRLLRAGDQHKVILGQTLAANLDKKVGDTVFFAADPTVSYEVIGIIKSPIVFENGGAIVSMKDGQALTGKLVTGFSVRVKKSPPNPATAVAAVQQKIEALRDPRDPTVRLSAVAPERR